MGKTQVVYMPDIDAGHIALGNSMGLCDLHGNPAVHAVVERTEYTTDCGVKVHGWHMQGQTVDIYVLPSRVTLKDIKAETLRDALNSFNKPRYDFGRYSFTGKFSTGDRSPTYTIKDKMGRGISTHSDMIKDFPGIFELMGHLGDNNGALFQPVIARYMWGIWHIMRGRKEPPKYQPIGYVDLRDYLTVLRDDRRHMFSKVYSKSLINIQLNRKSYVEVTGIDASTGQAMLNIGDSIVIDREKDTQFRPYVLITNRPLDIHDDLKFRWSKVEFQGHSVFLMPVMSRPSTFEYQIRTIDLLATTQST